MTDWKDDCNHHRRHSSLVTAAAILGIGRTAAYELIRTGTWPTPVLRLGKLIRIPTGPLLDLIQLRGTRT